MIYTTVCIPTSFRIKRDKTRFYLFFLINALHGEYRENNFRIHCAHTHTCMFTGWRFKQKIREGCEEGEVDGLVFNLNFCIENLAPSGWGRPSPQKRLLYL